MMIGDRTLEAHSLQGAEQRAISTIDSCNRLVASLQEGFAVSAQLTKVFHSPGMLVGKILQCNDGKMARGYRANVIGLSCLMSFISFVGHVSSPVVPHHCFRRFVLSWFYR